MHLGKEYVQGNKGLHNSILPIKIEIHVLHLDTNSFSCTGKRKRWKVTWALRHFPRACCSPEVHLNCVLRKLFCCFTVFVHLVDPLNKILRTWKHQTESDPSQQQGFGWFYIKKNRKTLNRVCFSPIK